MQASGILWQALRLESQDNTEKNLRKWNFFIHSKYHHMSHRDFTKKYQKINKLYLIFNERKFTGWVIILYYKISTIKNVLK